MSHLCVYHQSNSLQPVRLLNHQEDIARELAAIGSGFQRWPATVPVTARTVAEEVMAACQAGVAQLERAMAHADVIGLDENSAQEQAGKLRKQLSQEHVCDAEQAWLFAAGRGMLCLHVDGHVYALLCERGDLLTIPAGVKRWFDMGEQPRFVVTRLCDAAGGCEPRLTGEDVASRYPALED